MNKKILGAVAGAVVLVGGGTAAIVTQQSSAPPPKLTCARISDPRACAAFMKIKNPTAADRRNFEDSGP